MNKHKVTANQDYVMLSLDGDGLPCEHIDAEIDVDQYKGDELELWETRESDGFHFVYCNRLEIGYWVHPNLIDVNGVTTRIHDI